MKRRWIIAGFVGITVGAFALAGPLGLRVNTSESMPKGLWWKDSVDALVMPREFVAVCLPATGFIKRYIGHGSCDNGLEPVLKPIAAVAGDMVELGADGAKVNGVLLENTAPLAADAMGRALTPWPFGRYLVLKDEVWLLSTYSPRSFDSRYLGPVSTDLIIARGVPVLTWK